MHWDANGLPVTPEFDLRMQAGFSLPIKGVARETKRLWQRQYC